MTQVKESNTADTGTAMTLRTALALGTALASGTVSHQELLSPGRPLLWSQILSCDAEPQVGS